ncbi:outer membrane protein assembly factor BamD [Dissulfurirhabdus thermomarina]|uniref:Outer membrane protein assembly factor BamD n=1 Tax=Dissulfurirhabdus thermomarina TaxID=1765737 RepID=A0A6N9TVF7_DISTH|nr:outer membrane protein assembly factor BamD [Dissulfurirhabdus thermomarina]NDY42476.1 outer membrane protein assembly factor BamD [Dissulfurirhabdus thermomarina]NMX23369.1 outer membrane protein assembly factor BamD [Dissulfurirhabdus thermomarina]
MDVDRIGRLDRVPRRAGALAAVAAAVLVLAAGCGGAAPERKVGIRGEDAQLVEAADLARQAMAVYRKGQFIQAEELFQKLKDRFPFTPYASLAELRLADCRFYQGGRYEEAITQYEEFEKLHPANEAIPYVVFQIGTSYYRLMEAPDRDQTATRKMIETYERLLKRFPDSPYTLEARRRIAAGRERLAEHELVVARWYLRVGKRAQARFRLEGILRDYPETRTAATARRLMAGLVEAGDPGPS